MLSCSQVVNLSTYTEPEVDMIAFVVRIGYGFLFLVALFGVPSCAFLARLGVPDDVPITGGIAPDARLVVTAQVAPVYVEPNDTARVVGSLAVDTPLRAAGPDTDEWVRVRSIDSVVAGWVQRAAVEELRR